MKIHTFEKAFLGVSIVVLAAFFIALVGASAIHGITLPGRVGQIDPQQVRTTPPFDNPGVREIGPNRYEVVVIGQAWSFVPSEIRIPAGAEITFIATTPDVLHGFHIEKTKVNLMLIPGQVSRATHTFREPGEYVVICHEYCGLGHHTMYGKVIVE